MHVWQVYWGNAAYKSEFENYLRTRVEHMPELLSGDRLYQTYPSLVGLPHIATHCPPQQCRRDQPSTALRVSPKAKQ